MYHLLSTQNGGWQSQTGQFTTIREDAARYTRAEAIARCKRAKVQDSLVLVPVEESMVGEILA